MLIFPSNSVEEFNRFVIENTILTAKYVLRQIKKAVKAEQDAVTLFRLGQTPYISKITESEYPIALENYKNLFSNAEEYELAQECQNIIDMITDVDLRKALEKNNLNITFIDESQTEQ